jgi:hypothetical protein
MFEGEVTSMSHHPHGEVPNSLGEVTSTPLGDVTPVTHELSKKNFIKESSPEDPRTRTDLVTNQPIDDDHSFKEGKESSEVGDLSFLVLRRERRTLSWELPRYPDGPRDCREENLGRE